MERERKGEGTEERGRKREREGDREGREAIILSRSINIT